MARNIIILGAGASAQYGAPVMANFLDVAKDLYFAGDFRDWEKEGFPRVLNAISKLQSVHSKSSLDISNIESVLTAFEMASVMTPEFFEEGLEIDTILEDFKKIISATLCETLTGVARTKDSTYWGSKDYNVPLPNELYELFITATNRNLKQVDTAIITFNYDLLIDVIATTVGNGECATSVDYGIQPSKSGGTPLLKLHGSLNWLRDGKGVKPIQVNSFSLGSKRDTFDCINLVRSNVHEFAISRGISPTPVISKRQAERLLTIPRFAFAQASGVISTI